MKISRAERWPAFLFMKSIKKRTKTTTIRSSFADDFGLKMSLFHRMVGALTGCLAKMPTLRTLSQPLPGPGQRPALSGFMGPMISNRTFSWTFKSCEGAHLPLPLTLPMNCCKRSSSSANVSAAEWREVRSLRRMHFEGPKIQRQRRHPLEGKPQLRGVVLKTVIKKPKKPNSANRKCVLVRLSNGKEATAFVPGIGHNLQEHSVVLVQTKRTRDVPGLKLRCIRGAYDLPQVVKKSQTPT